MVVHEEFTLTTAAGPGLYGQRWVPDGRPAAALALVHGFGEHTGRYAHVGEAFARGGVALCGVDLPGHGRTKGRRGVTSRVQLLEVAADLVRDTKARFSGSPVFLYGHSMGGSFVLLAGLATAGLDAKGVIASSPLVRLAARAPAWKVTAARILARVAPSFTMPNPLVLEHLSRDPRVVEAVRTDPLYHTIVSARLGWDIMEWEKQFGTFEGRFPVPLLVQQGSEDRIVDPAATLALAGRLSGNVTVRRWDGLFHELHNEPEREAVMEYVLDWVRGIAA
jgi:alpha-beta hydrolase superfamily lysophospholipase